jgi:tRNA uridine 5-carboxymethylaminomethyl modification enzyme
MKKYDIIIIGAGHAGTEAALACARMGCKSLLITMKKAAIAHMPCNPSVGGIGKGQLVKEVDALGGEMARAADATGIHFKILNKGHGPAVWSSRVQVDRARYADYMRLKIMSQANLDTIEDEACGLVLKDSKVYSVETKVSGAFTAEAFVLTPGTFLNGIIHIGLDSRPGGCYGEPASVELSVSLRGLGLETGILKTGTTARIRKDTIDFSGLIPQHGDDIPLPFSFSTKTRPKNSIVCHITHTNEKTHSIIRNNLDRSPLYTGIIKSTGVRYCPSIEDKIVKFADRASHHIFLEPEGIDTDWYYPNGLSTSLPLDVQMEMIHSVKGLEKAEVIVPGYGIEYEFIQPTELLPSLQTKKFSNLFLAGQINGTTGYEEAAAQGLIAGINAALKVMGKRPFILTRAESYIGVLIDDLVTKGTDEPYRMFTSRVEYRLMLREDNADLRLRRHGHNLGLVPKSDLDESDKKAMAINNAICYLDKQRISPGKDIDAFLNSLGTSKLKKTISASELLRRPQVSYEHIKYLKLAIEALPYDYERTVETMVKYQGFIRRQQIDINKMQDIEKIKLPDGMDFSKIPGLSTEIVQKLSYIRPVSLGQASRISGVTPSAIMILMVYMKKNK